jgi:hypothetical protein
MRDAKGRFVKVGDTAIFGLFSQANEIYDIGAPASGGPMTFCEKHGRQPNVSRFPKLMASCPVCNREAESLAAAREGLRRYAILQRTTVRAVAEETLQTVAFLNRQHLTPEYSNGVMHIRQAWRDQHA